MKRIIRYTFHDGTVVEYNAAQVAKIKRRQRHALKIAQRQRRALASRNNGMKGGRRPIVRPSDGDLLLRLGDHWLRDSSGVTSSTYRDARAWLVRTIAAECQVEERTARGWVSRAFQPVAKAEKS